MESFGVLQRFFFFLALINCALILCLAVDIYVMQMKGQRALK